MSKFNLEKDPQETLDEIIVIVDWYRQLAKDYTNISDLMYARKMLSTLMFSLSKSLSDSRTLWKENEFNVEFHKRNKMIELLNNDTPVSKAIEYSKYSVLKLVEIEKNSEIEHQKLKLFLDHSHEINNAIMQHISILRKELDASPQLV